MQDVSADVITAQRGRTVEENRRRRRGTGTVIPHRHVIRDFIREGEIAWPNHDSIDREIRLAGGGRRVR